MCSHPNRIIKLIPKLIWRDKLQNTLAWISNKEFIFIHSILLSGIWKWSFTHSLVPFIWKRLLCCWMNFKFEFNWFFDVLEHRRTVLLNGILTYKLLPLRLTNEFTYVCMVDRQHKLIPWVIDCGLIHYVLSDYYSEKNVVSKYQCGFLIDSFFYLHLTLLM